MRFARKIALLPALALIGLSACETVGERSQSFVPALTFAHYKTLPLDVGKVDIRSTYEADAHEGNVAHLFPTTPEDAFTRYLHRRYAATPGHRSGLAMIVHDAHAIRKQVGADSGGVKSVIGLKGQERYTVFIELALEHRTAEDQLIRRAVLNFRKGMIVPISLSLAERERRMNGFIQRFMRDIDQSVQNALSESLHILPANKRTSPEQHGHGRGLMPGVPRRPVSSGAPEMGMEQDKDR